MGRVVTILLCLQLIALFVMETAASGSRPPSAKPPPKGKPAPKARPPPRRRPPPPLPPPPPSDKYTSVVDPNNNRVIYFDPSNNFAGSVGCRAPLVATAAGCVYPKGLLKKLPAFNIDFGGGEDAIVKKKEVERLVKFLESCADSSSYIVLNPRRFPALVTLGNVTTRDYHVQTVELSLLTGIQDAQEEKFGEIQEPDPLPVTLERTPTGDYRVLYLLVVPPKFAPNTTAVVPHQRRRLTELTADEARNCAAITFGSALAFVFVAVVACLPLAVLFFVAWGACLAVALGIAVSGGVIAFGACLLANAFEPAPAPSCFPGDAMARLAGGLALPMSQLEVGQAIVSGPLGAGAALVPLPHLSEVYAFSHRDPLARATFVSLHLASGKVIELSPRHFVPYSAADMAPRTHKFKYAEDIEEGDLLWESTGSSYALTKVVRTRLVRKLGLYNPLVLSGTIEVNGIVASCHSNWFLDNVVSSSVVPHLPAIYQAMLTPARMLYYYVGPEGAKVLQQQLHFDESDSSFEDFASLLTAAAKTSLALPTNGKCKKSIIHASS